MVTGYIDVTGVEHLLDELEEMMVEDMHLYDPVAVAEQIGLIDPHYPTLSDDDKIFITCVLQAFEEQTPWDDGMLDEEYFDSLAFTQQNAWKFDEAEGGFKKFEMNHQGLITPDEFKEEYGDWEEWSENQ